MEFDTQTSVCLVQFIGVTVMADNDYDQRRRQYLHQLANIFAGLVVGLGRALTDTAAQVPTIGDNAERVWRRMLFHMGLCPVMVCQSVAGQVNGVGSTQIKFIADYPVGLCGINTIVRFTILKDGQQQIPSLMSVDSLRDREA